MAAETGPRIHYGEIMEKPLTEEELHQQELAEAQVPPRLADQPESLPDRVQASHFGFNLDVVPSNLR